MDVSTLSLRWACYYVEVLDPLEKDGENVDLGMSSQVVVF